MSQPFETPEGGAAFVEGLTFLDEPVSDADIPPVLEPGEDVLVPRSFKLPSGLDAALAETATRRGVTKSDLVREYLQAAVASDLADAQEGEVLIPLADALRALVALRHHPAPPDHTPAPRTSRPEC